MSTFSDLRGRAELIGCRVRRFQRNYRFLDKPVRYSLIDQHGELFASNLVELRQHIKRAEAELEAHMSGEDENLVDLDEVVRKRREAKRHKKKQPKRDPAEMREAERVQYDAQDREKWESSARHIIESEDVLGLLAQVWRKIVAGEERNAKLLYLVATSRLFDRCMSAAVKGPSSAGKSEIRRQVLEFFPPENVVSFTTLSEKSLLYYEGDFSHKILSMGEASGAEEQTLQDYLLRELISEGRLRYPVVQKVEGAGLITVTVEKSGPVVFLITTTKAALHAENETRMLSLEIDDSDEQTRSVLDKVAEIVGLNVERGVINYEPWRDFQRWLGSGNCKVIIPFAGELAALIPPRSVRLRRDFSQILLAIRAHALVHRHHRQIDERGQIIADIWNDYTPIVELMGGIVAEASGAGMPKELAETIEAVKLLTAGMGKDEGATADKIAKRLRLDKSAAWRRLNKASFAGFVVNLEIRKGQPGRYRLTNQEFEAEELLPPPEAIIALRGAVQPAQPCNRTPEREKYQADSGCTAGCKPVAWGEDAPTAEKVACNRATAHATANPLRNNGKTPPVARLHGLHGGIDEDAFEERAAILEFDGGLSRDEAEAQAAEELPQCRTVSTR